MTYAQLPRHPWLNLPSVAIVVALHVVAIYAFMHVMGVVSVTPRLPTMVRMIPETVPPPPDAPKIALPDMPAPPLYLPKVDVKLPSAVPPPDAPRATSDKAAPPSVATRGAPGPAPAAASGAPSLPPQFVSGDRAPAYPDAYAENARAGRVVVDCVIETTGRPTGCRVVESSGGAAFASETMRWLSGPSHPVYRPSSKDGRPVREEHQWAVSFEPPQ